VARLFKLRSVTVIPSKKAAALANPFYFPKCSNEADAETGHYQEKQQCMFSIRERAHGCYDATNMPC
jgi:hypothetical protein